MKRAAEESDLRQWAELVLPWLPPADLAAAAATCKALNDVARAVSVRRASDAARGLEHHPIPFLNPTATAADDGDGDAQPYSYFLYTRFPLLAFFATIPSSQTWGGDPDRIPTLDPSSMEAFASPIDGNDAGCRCEERCCIGEDVDSNGCPCWSTKIGSLLDSSTEMGELMMTECGAHCACEVDCANRSTQRGVSVGLRIVRDRKKGWGLHAAQFIASGQFVCEYAGEFLTTAEARRRQQIYDELASGGRFSPALLVVREHLPSGKACLRVNIDATKVGNIARFINHSCDGGNLLAILVRNSGSLLPRLCFFAARNILDHEELTFSYGDANHSQKGLPCFCGSSQCSGTLPSEET